MNFKRTIAIVFVTFAATFLIRKMIKSVSDNLKCDFGPIYGKSIQVDIKSIKIDTFLKIPQGQLAFANTRLFNDSTNFQPPILIKLDNKKKVLWAIKFEMEKEEGEENETIGINSIKLIDDNEEKKIHFFNTTFREPGTIYLTEDYDFECMCLSIF